MSKNRLRETKGGERSWQTSEVEQWRVVGLATQEELQKCGQGLLGRQHCCTVWPCVYACGTISRRELFRELGK